MASPRPSAIPDRYSPSGRRGRGCRLPPLWRPRRTAERTRARRRTQLLRVGRSIGRWTVVPLLRQPQYHGAPAGIAASVAAATDLGAPKPRAATAPSPVSRTDRLRGGVRMPANGPGDRPARLIVLCRSRDGAWVRICTHLATRLAPRERAFGLRRVTVQLPGHGWERRAGAPASASSAGRSSPSRRSPAKASGVARIRPPFARTGEMVGEPSAGVASPPLPLGDAPWALSAPARHPTGCQVGRTPVAVPLAILAARRILRSRSPRHRAFGSGR